MTNNLPTIEAFKLKKQEELDRKWLEKYPNGLGYIIITRQNRIKVGWLTARPTSGWQKVSRKEINTGDYTGSSFYNVQKHKTYPNKEDWINALIKVYTEVEVRERT